MDPIAWVPGDGPDRPGHGSVDPLQRVVQVSLAIYLMPVVAIVCAIGGVSIALGAVGRLAGKLTAGGHRPAWPGPHSVGTSGRTKTPQTGERRRVRV
jgi:hypothetical protein